MTNRHNQLKRELLQRFQNKKMIYFLYFLASLNAIAIACFFLVTRFLPPDFNFPFLNSSKTFLIFDLFNIYHTIRTKNKGTQTRDDDRINADIVTCTRDSINHGTIYTSDGRHSYLRPPFRPNR